MGFTLNTSFNEKYHYFNEISKLDHLNWFPYVRYKIIITFSFKWRSSVPSFTSSITYHNRGCERQHYALYLLMIQTLSYTRLAPVENINAHLCRTARVTSQPVDKLKSRELNSEDCIATRLFFVKSLRTEATKPTMGKQQWIAWKYWNWLMKLFS